jgi:dihydroorotate dehydrogenase (NAD+) catalytic subunit
MGIDVETQRPILSHKIGGLSGAAIKPVAVRCVYEIASKYNIPVIGCGGVYGWEDAVEFILAGASAVQVGSAIGDKWLDVFSEINDGMANYMKRKGFSKISEMVGLAKRF